MNNRDPRAAPSIDVVPCNVIVSSDRRRHRELRQREEEELFLHSLHPTPTPTPDTVQNGDLLQSLAKTEEKERREELQSLLSIVVKGRKEVEAWGWEGG